MNLEQIKKEFIEKYGEGVFQVFNSPGRVNLIGEHTDYNGGRVFPCALSFGIYLIVRKTNDSVIKFSSTDYDFSTEIKINDLKNKIENQWVNYPLGVFNQFIDRGIEISGLEMMYSGNIPIGAGLSSSAAIEVVTAVALNDIFDGNISMIEMVKLSQRAENEFIGVNCGIMDQFAVGMGKRDHAIALDCDTLDYEHVPVVLNDCKIVIVNTNKPRGLIDSKYNERRAECDKALELISSVKNIDNLCQLSNIEFKENRGKFNDDVIERRAKHVISENERVREAVEALKQGDLELFGKLMNESHRSLKEDYEVTGDELDTLVEEAQKIDGVIGARMTGAGFGGCTVNLVKDDVIDDFCRIVGENYKKRIGYEADFYIAEVGNGAGRIE